MQREQKLARTARAPRSFHVAYLWLRRSGDIAHDCKVHECCLLSVFRSILHFTPGAQLTAEEQWAPSTKRNGCYVWGWPVLGGHRRQQHAVVNVSQSLRFGSQTLPSSGCTSPWNPEALAHLWRYEDVAEAGREKDHLRAHAIIARQFLSDLSQSCFLRCQDGDKVGLVERQLDLEDPKPEKAEPSILALWL